MSTDKAGTTSLSPCGAFAQTTGRKDELPWEVLGAFLCGLAAGAATIIMNQAEKRYEKWCEEQDRQRFSRSEKPNKKSNKANQHENRSRKS